MYLVIQELHIYNNDGMAVKEASASATEEKNYSRLMFLNHQALETRNNITTMSELNFPINKIDSTANFKGIASSKTYSANPFQLSTKAQPTPHLRPQKEKKSFRFLLFNMKEKKVFVLISFFHSIHHKHNPVTTTYTTKLFNVSNHLFNHHYRTRHSKPKQKENVKIILL
ncbi:CLUMA_CG019642, isoform A [Clunio marinus]|uniref:CLUMA_CG019642, isoform A n=1 Tax=Clunio marinus TaxID=568069 RepID=A0A1J1J478_9DIPT|nr:CLUMA_CG019642, isoform A [Clunio marinus]